MTFSPKEDPKYSTGTFYVNVTAVNADDLDASGMAYTFMISFAIGTHSQQLIDGNPVQDTVKSGYYSYFTFVYGPGKEDILLRLTTIAGDPDILVSLSPSVKFPTKENADVTSASDRESDTIRISGS